MSKTNDENLEDWKVDIPVEFKERLESRFNAKNAFEKKLFCVISKSCILCEKYKKNKCRKCPFIIFEDSEKYGCWKWIENIIGNLFFTLLIDKIFWEINDDKEAREQLERLREAAEKLINWVE